jgi:CHAT domain-containing protein/tetratricopeptide (TPR) repeat protein
VRARVALGALALASLVLTGAAHAARPADPVLAEARARLARGRFAAAESTARAALVRAAGRGRAAALDSAAAIEVLSEAMWQNDRERDSTALALAERGVRLRERHLGPNAPEVSASLLQWASMLGGNGRVEEAQAAARRAVAIAERARGPDDTLAAAARHHLGRMLYLGRRFAEARVEFEAALAVRQRLLPADHPALASSWRAIASAAQVIGDRAAAADGWRRATEIAERALPEDHPDLARALQGLSASLYQEQRYLEARRAAERALAITERVLGPEHPRIAFACMQLAWSLGGTGDFGPARSLYERAHRVFEKAFGPEDPLTLEALDFVAAVMTWTGDCAAALPIAERCLAARRRVRGDAHPEVTRAIQTLSLVRQCVGDTLGALATAIEEGERFAREQGEDSGALVSALRRQAELRAALGERDTARALFARALDIGRRRLGPSSPLARLAEEGLAGLLVESGEADSARRMLTRLVAVAERAYGPHGGQTATALERLAVAEAASGDAPGAIRTALVAETAGREAFRATARGFAEREALAAAAVRTRGLDLALTLAASRPCPDSLARALWDALARSRALVLDEVADRRHVRSAHPADTLRQRLDEARARLARLLTRGAAGAESVWAERVREAREASDRAERAVALADAAYRGDQARAAAGLGEIEAALPPGAALLAYARHRVATVGAPRGAAWVAFVREPGGRVSLTPLGDAAAVDAALAEWARELARPVPAEAAAARAALRRCRAAGERVRRLVWDPLAPRLAAAGRVVLVPDGPLALVDLAALPVGRDRWLAEEGPTLALAGAERDLARAATDRPGEGLLALGGIDYQDDGSGRELVAASVRSASPAAAEARGLPGCAAFERLAFGPLPESRREADDVAAAWREAGRGLAEVLSGGAAGEAAFKRAARGRRAIHLATHGFFVDPACASADAAGERGVTGLAAITPGAPAPAAADPLRLAGLALAGANARAAAPPEAEDGVLTAGEIAGLDLAGTELVTLSACESGLGEAVSGEGVLGLRRAFRVAGAGAVLMSLWAVRDQPTRAWMADFYRSLWRDGQGLAESVRAASRAAIARLRAAGRPDHPGEWAGFVAEGGGR